MSFSEELLQKDTWMKPLIGYQKPSSIESFNIPLDQLITLYEKDTQAPT